VYYYRAKVKANGLIIFWKDFNQVIKNCELNAIGKGSFKVLGFDDLIYYKQLSGRPKDLLDILELKSIRKTENQNHSDDFVLKERYMNLNSF